MKNPPERIVAMPIVSGDPVYRGQVFACSLDSLILFHVSGMDTVHTHTQVNDGKSKKVGPQWRKSAINLVARQELLSLRLSPRA